jgi:hypothetical protein
MDSSSNLKLNQRFVQLNLKKGNQRWQQKQKQKQKQKKQRKPKQKGGLKQRDICTQSRKQDPQKTQHPVKKQHSTSNSKKPTAPEQLWKLQKQQGMLTKPAQTQRSKDKNSSVQQTQNNKLSNQRKSTKKGRKRRSRRAPKVKTQDSHKRKQFPHTPDNFSLTPATFTTPKFAAQQYTQYIGPDNIATSVKPVLSKTLSWWARRKAARFALVMARRWHTDL